MRSAVFSGIISVVLVFSDARRHQVHREASQALTVSSTSPQREDFDVVPICPQPQADDFAVVPDDGTVKEDQDAQPKPSKDNFGVFPIMEEPQDDDYSDEPVETAMEEVQSIQATPSKDGIVLYGSESCGMTVRTIRELKEANVPFVFKKLDQESRSEMWGKVRAAGIEGSIGLPVCELCGELEFQPRDYAAFVERAHSCASSGDAVPKKPTLTPTKPEEQQIKELVLYGRESCGMCKWTKRELDKAGVPYTFKDYTTDDKGKNEMFKLMQKNGISGSFGLPVCNVCGQVELQPRDMKDFLARAKQCMGAESVPTLVPKDPIVPTSVPKDPSVPTSVPTSVPNSKLVLYGSAQCGMTKWAMRELDEANVEYIFKDTNGNQANNKAMWAKVREAGIGGSIGLPVCDVCGKLEFQPRDMASFVKRAGQCVSGGDAIPVTTTAPQKKPATNQEKEVTESSNLHIFGHAGCGMTQMVRRQLDEASIPYIFKDYKQNKAFETDMWSKIRSAGISGRIGLPVCDVCGKLDLQPRDMASFLKQARQCAEGGTGANPEVETTKAPVETTKAPVETTKAPVETTKAPVETTKAPAPTKIPVETTKAPEDSTQPSIVSVGFMVQNIDHTQLTADAAMLALFKTETAKAIVSQIKGVSEGDVTVEVSPGSVIVKAVIAAADVSRSSLIAQSLGSGVAAFKEVITSNLKAIPNISKVSSGELSVAELSIKSDKMQVAKSFAAPGAFSSPRSLWMTLALAIMRWGFTV